MKILPTLEDLKKDYQKITAYKFLITLLFIFSILAVGQGMISRAKEEKISRFHFDADVIAGNDDIVLHIGDYDPKDFAAYIELPNKSKELVEYDYDRTLGEIKLKNFSRRIAGKYTLLLKERGLEIFQKDFIWGVLAINTNKSVYTEGETAQIQIGVLDEKGMMVCDADVGLQIFASDGRLVGELSTKNLNIKVNEECNLHKYTEVPDYEAEFRFRELGDYQLKLTAKTRNGEYTISDNVRVSDDILVDVERLTSTRIYPFDPYPVKLRATFRENFEGRIEETVPEDFRIAESPVAMKFDRIDPDYAAMTKKLIWEVKATAGETLILGYVFDAPDISPNFYTLGELKFFKYEKILGDILDSGDSTSNDTVLFGETQSSFTDEIPQSSESTESMPEIPVVSESTASSSSNETLGSLDPSPTFTNSNIKTKESPYFQEFRKWQLAIDAATYTGKHTRTIEYTLGSSASGTALTDNTSRASGTTVYAGSSWNATKGTASTKTVYISGSGIKVLQAYVDVGFHINTAGGANDLTDVDVTLDVANGPAGGSDIRIGMATAPIIQDRAASDLTSTFRAYYDATALFSEQNDGQFNAGLATVGSVQHTGGARALTFMRLVITYEQDYSTTAHTETKTVRFPLNSSVAGDEGSTQAVCAGSTTCGFTYNANIPDATADANIRDVFFEIHAQVNSATASTIQPQISGGTAGPAYAWVDAQAGDTNIMVLWRPTVGSPNFQRSTAQTLNIVNGTVPINILGGELVVTYDFSTGAATQTETVQYFMLQQTAATGITKTTNTAVSTTISNTGRSVTNIWYKAYAAESEANTWTLYGTVGAGTERSQAYTVGGANTIRAGAIAVVYLDLTQDIANYSAATTNLDVETQWSSATGDAPITVEAFITFTWSGSSGGTVTKTVMYSGTPSGAATVASEYYNKPISITLPENVTKTHRSTYILADLSRSDATNITIGTMSLGVNTTTAGANIITVTEAGEEGTTTTAEGYVPTIAYSVNDTMFSDGATIAWKEKTFQTSVTSNQADELYASFQFVVTYDAAMGGITLDQNHYRWRDDTAALNTNSGWTYAIDTINTTLSASTTARLRVEIANTGGATASDYPFTLEYAARTGLTCGDETFGSVPVTATTEAFEMVVSSQYVDQDVTSPSLLTATGTYANGRGVEDPANQTVAIDVPNGYYTELEYAIQATTNAVASQTYCFRLTNVGSSTNFTYSIYPEVTIAGGGNTAPNVPASLQQVNAIPIIPLSTGEWMNLNTVAVGAIVSDPDSSDTLYICAEIDPLGTAFSNTEDTCDAGQAYSGTPLQAGVVRVLSDATEYHWQVRTRDAAGAYSAWVSYGGNAESARDFGIDTTAPTGGTVFDGSSAGVDSDFSTTSLSALSANWSGFNANVSGLSRYEYALGTSAGGTQVIGWTSNTTNTSVSLTGLTLQTSQPYYFSVRAVDNAGSTQSPVISSDGIYVSPTLTFTLSSNTVTFSTLNSGNSYNDTKTTTLSASTNAYGGYVIRAFETSLLTHNGSPSLTIANFNGGTYALPDQFQTSDRGFGYTSDDTTIQGSNKFQNNPCPGGGTPSCYAPFASTGPGDIVADHTANVTGTPVSNTHTITYQIRTDSTQQAGSYSTTIIYTMTPVY